VWFDVNPGRGSLAKLEVKTEKMSVYETPTPMSPLGGSGALDVDGKGRIWTPAPDGVVAFDPESEKFTDFKSMTPFKNAKGTNSTHGAAGDRDGNGWWAQMATPGYVAHETAKSLPISGSDLNAYILAHVAKLRATAENCKAGGLASEVLQ
jgi:hypothetical protein